MLEHEPAKCHCGSSNWGREPETNRYTCVSCYRPLWAPMELAPKDGSSILAVLYWERSNWTEIEVIEWDEDEEQWYGGKNGWLEEGTFTGHWMPLPDLPKLD